MSCLNPHNPCIHHIDYWDVFMASFITYCLENSFLWDLKFLVFTLQWTKCWCRDGQSFENSWTMTNSNLNRWIFFVFSGPEEMPRYTKVSVTSGLLCMGNALFLGTQKKLSCRKMTSSKRKCQSILGLLKAYSFPCCKTWVCEGGEWHTSDCSSGSLMEDGSAVL